MMKIQVISLSENEKEYEGNDIKLSTLAEPDSLDMYDINVINLDNQAIWKNNSTNRRSVNIYKDLKNIGVMIEQAKNTKNIIILPQNYRYYYHYNYGKFQHSEELKNMLGDLSYIISNIDDDFLEQSLYYENTKTKIREEIIDASFWFGGVGEYDVLTKSEGSQKITTIVKNDIIYTTLKIDNRAKLLSFLRVIKMINEKEKTPNWMKEVKLFNDLLLEETIDECEKIIEEEECKIRNAEEDLEKNNYYKSVLYTQSDELVEVVHCILEEMLGFDFSSFKDKKREDFLYVTDTNSYIGEIKGISSNVKSANVSQLDVHYHTYLDDNPDKKGKTFAWLIMNHQRTKPILERESIHEEQITIARRNGSLIIETYVLLKLFEKYKSGSISREKCLELMTIKTGILLEKDFE